MQTTSRGKLSKIIIDVKSPRGHVLVKEKFLLATVSISDHSRVSTQIKAFKLPGQIYIILLASPKKKNKQTNRKNIGRDTATAVANYSRWAWVIHNF